MLTRFTRPAFVFPAAFVALAAVSGCAKTNPAVGTWTGPNATSLTLAADGTGTVSIPPVLQNKAITWKDGEDKKIDLSFAPAGGSGTAATANTATGAGGGGMTMPATLGEDGKTMSITLPMTSVTLTKAEAAK